ncbi:membrane protein insertion efficiency factor YidD [bacterium]|nr:membrane protein insertion efficiency factor YidD [bacterium]MBU1599871.1 membrane protein insertion efficiency factor YidD [bacterium]MBU2461899.1 membrane protein insertion efficiency factor YidD [bacterium]
MIIKGGYLLLIIVALAIFVTSFSYAQEISELTFIVKSNPIKEEAEKKEQDLIIKETSEIKLFMLGSIRFYQLFISSQDKPACNFIPSCSQFGMETTKRFGFTQGLLLTSDRLQRCHCWTRRYYPLDKDTDKAIDPAMNYGD